MSDYAAEYKALRKAVLSWIRADFYCHNYAMRSGEAMAQLNDAERALRDIATGEPELWCAALAAKSPCAIEMVPKYCSYYPKPETYRVEDMIDAIKAGKKW